MGGSSTAAAQKGGDGEVTSVLIYCALDGRIIHY